MPTTGRPRALDEIKQREICALVSAGCSLREAARYVRCGRATIQRELTRNADFRQRIDEAAMASQVSPLKAMQKAAGNHWRAAAWLLERTKPERYARRVPLPMKKRQARRLVDRILEIVRTEVPDPIISDRLKHRLRDAVEEAVPGTVTKGPDADDLRRAMQVLRPP